MAKSGIESNDWKKFYESLESNFGSHERDAFMRGAVNNLSQRLNSNAKRRTPVDTGNLRRNFKVTPAHRSGSAYEGGIHNTTEYASYVEYGHRQEPGRYIPGHWKGDEFVYQPGDPAGGMILSKVWVEGYFMVQKSMNSLEPRVVRILDQLLDAKMREIDKGAR